MFEAALKVILAICQITTISAILFKIFDDTKATKIFFEFMQKHKIISVIYLIMTAVGLFSIVFYVK